MSKILVGYYFFCLFSVLLVSVSSYEYGYHPSSEEFDGTMRDRTWTRDLLWQERNTKTFTPKFSLQKLKDTSVANSFISSSNSFSDKKDTNTDTDMDSDTIGLSSEFVQEVTRDSQENQANHTEWPIYFTNPATGIVYAITKVGVNGNQTALPKNGSVPIFVSKEQYEQDLYLLKRSIESKCNRQGRPQIIKLDSGSFVNKPTPVFVKTELKVKGNRTRVKKRKNRHRKVKKTKSGHMVQILTKNSSLPIVTVSPLDTQLEKPNKVNLLSVFSSSQTIPPYSNKTPNKTKKSPTRHTTKFHHKLNKRSLDSTDLNQIFLNTSTTKRSLNSSDSGEKSKKILSTQIQVTSEYLEPTTKIRTPKNSLEETTNNPKPKFPSKPPSESKSKYPCNDTKLEKPASKEYDDYYDFGGPYYDDYSTGDDETAEDEDGSNESIEYKASSETTITDYSSVEEASKPNEDYQPRKPLQKRIKRRRPYSDDYDEDYDDDYDNESDDGVMGLFRTIFTPVQWVMDKVFERAGQMLNKNSQDENDDDNDNDNDNRKPKYPHYTVYNSGSADEVTESEETSGDQGNSFGSWFSSWFGFKRKSRTTTPAPVEDEPGWFDSWFGYDVRTPSPNEEEDNDSWFFGWFNSKPRPKRTTTTTTTTPVPILTIAEPLKNPQKWIGILAQHIINSTTTNNPFIETTTENPEIPKKISYNKYQIWRLKPKDNSQVKALEDYKRGEEGARLQWLMGPSLRGLTDVLIPPKMLIDFQGTLNFEDIPHETLIFDVGKAISYEEAKQDDTSTVPQMKAGKGKAVMSWNRYYDYDSIITYLELVQQRNPHLVELIHVGRSYEGRPLVIVKVESKRNIEKPTKKKKLKLNKKSDLANGVFIEAGVHGREWIAPATATWMINELLKIMKNNRTNLGSEYIKNSTWYIMPVANPDSYEYSHQYDRFWKKSRSRHIAKPSGIINSAMTWLQKKKSEKLCFGVDLDCNWHYNWGRRGSSKSPCNEFFAGPTPFSEPETRAISKFLMDNRKQIRLFLSLQAYGQIISYPNKLNSSFQSQKLDDFLDVAMVGTDGLRKKGSKSRYKVDSSNDLIESKSGSSDYFSAFEVGIPFSYTIHLADNGVHGFLLPSVYIEPTARDAFEIITAMIDYI